MRTAEGSQFSVAGLSSGQKHLLVLYLTAASLVDSVLLIDEPEISLHQRWEVSLIEDILSVSKRMQLIVATHSGEIVGRLPPESLLHL